MKEYVASCNPLNFNIVDHFNNTNEILWRQTKKCECGDVVYLYVGRPYSYLMYKCSVLEANIPNESVERSYYNQQAQTKRSKDKPYMKLKLLDTFDGKGFSLQELQDHGLKTVQCTTEVCDELHNYILKISRR